jgi:glycosyltransferase involved in cell wall biosynthesis
MKIGVDLSALNFKYIGGIGIYVKNLLESIDVNEREYFTLFYPIKSEFNRSLQFYKTGTLGLSGRFGTLEWYYLGGILLKKYGLDTFWGPAYIIPRGLDKNVKTIVTIHDSLIFLKSSNREMIIKELWHTLYHQSARHSQKIANKVITISKTSANDLEQIFPGISKKLEIISPSINKNLFKIIPDAYQKFFTKYGISKPFVLIIHMESERKNFRLVIDSFKKQDKGVLCAVGRLSDSKVSYAKSQLGDRFFYLGYVDETDLPIIYSAANVLIAPSRAEGFDIPPLEARACGTNVIASDISVHREVLENEAEYFEIDDANKLSKLIFDSLSTNKIIVPSKIIDKYDWRQSAIKLLKMFSE